MDSVKADGATIKNAAPNIEADICASAKTPLTGVPSAAIDGRAIIFVAGTSATGVPGCGGLLTPFTYKPQVPLGNGLHTLTVSAVNSLDLESDDALTFTVAGQPTILVGDASGRPLKQWDYIYADQVFAGVSPGLIP